MTLAAVLRALVLAGLAGPGGPAQAQVLPMLFQVSGVRPGGALYVRAAPGNRAHILGVVRAGGAPFEIVAEDRTGFWGQVNLGERAGWVSLRHIKAQANPWARGGIPGIMRCFGSAPLWSLRMTPKNAQLSRAGAPDAAFEVKAALAVGLPEEPWREIIAQSGGMRLTGLLSPKTCGDGRSKLVYGLSIDVVLEAQGGTTLLEGCCSMAPQG